MTSDQCSWGFMVDGTFVPVPREPLELGGLGPPPFDVRLPSGEMRRIVEGPAADGQDARPESAPAAEAAIAPAETAAAMFVPQAVIVTGPVGCGKTRNALRIARFYNRDRIIDDWKAGDPTPAGSVCLTRDIVPGAVPFDDIAHLLPPDRGDAAA